MESVRRARVSCAFALWAVVVSACAGSRGIAPSDAVPTTVFTAPSTTAVAIDVPTSTYGGTVVVGVADGGAPRGLNPFLEGPDSGVLDLIAPAVFAQGFDTDPVTGERRPDALAALPSLDAGTVIDNGDGTMTVTVEIVEGARWADREPISAADLEYTIRIATDPALPIRAEIAAAYDRIVPGSVQADGRVLTFTMSAGSDPAALFEVIIPRHAVETSDFAADWDDTLWVSGGPFVLSDWEPGWFVELARNEEYWKATATEGARLPFLDRLVIRFFEPGTDLDTRLIEGFDRGDLDVAVFERAEDRSGSFSDAVAAGAVVETSASGEWDHLNFQFGPANRNDASLNANLAFRQAVAAAIDRDALADRRGTRVVDSILGEYLPGIGTDPYAVYTPDPEVVEGRLYDAEVATGSDTFAGDGPAVLITVASDVPSTVALAGDLVVMLREAGIGAQLQLEGSNLFFGSTLDNGSWDVSTWRIGSGDGLGAAIDFFEVYDPDGLPFIGENFFRWGTIDSTVTDAATRRYAEIIDEIATTVDPAAILELLIEAETILAEELVLLPLISAHQVGTAHWPARVSGVVPNGSQGVLWNVDTWRRPIG